MKKIVKIGAILTGVGAVGYAAYKALKNILDREDLISLTEPYEFSDADAEYLKNAEKEKKCSCGGDCHCDETGECHCHDEQIETAKDEDFEDVDRQTAINNFVDVLKEVEKKGSIEKPMAEKEAVKKGKRAVVQLDTDMSVIKRYDSIAQAAKESGFSTTAIRNALKNDTIVGEYYWKDAE